jgi:hypothetical protein
MSPPDDRLPGGGADEKSAADREEELRNQAIQLAMLASSFNPFISLGPQDSNQPILAPTLSTRPPNIG